MKQEKRTRTRNRVPRIDSSGIFRKRKISDEFDFSVENNGYMKIFNSIPKNTPLGNPKRKNFQKGEPSNSKYKKFYCKICTDTKTTGEAFYISCCSHAYCSDCVAKHIHYRLDHNIINIKCPFPGCRGSLEPEFCRSILPTEDFKRWNKAVCEVLFNVTEKFYCPFADCSALLINDGTEAVKNLECPNCNRMLCGQCKARCHEGIECSEFEKLKRDDKGKDVMLTNIAKDMMWRQCPKCRFYVAKSESSNIMRCRCQCRFCYNCGDVFSTGRCNCYKRNSIYSDQRRKHIRPRVSKENVYTNETLPNKKTLCLSQELEKLLDNYITFTCQNGPPSPFRAGPGGFWTASGRNKKSERKTGCKK